MTKIIYLCITGQKNAIVMHQKYIEMFLTIIYLALGHGHTIVNSFTVTNFGSGIRIDLGVLKQFSI